MVCNTQKQQYHPELFTQRSPSVALYKSIRIRASFGEHANVMITIERKHNKYTKATKPAITH